VRWFAGSRNSRNVSNAVENGPGFSHQVTVRVRYPETDRMGVVYHAHYLVWFEMGRTELMRELGCSYADLEDDRNLFFPVIDARVRYHVSARYDDLLTVGTRVESVRGASVRFAYEVTRAGESTALATGFTEHAAVGPNGRPVRLPEEIRRHLSNAS